MQINRDGERCRFRFPPVFRNIRDFTQYDRYCCFFFLYGLHGIIRWKSHLIDVIVLVGGVVEDGVQPCCHCFNPLTNKWHYMSPVIDSRLNFGLARLQGCLIAVGGSTVGEKMTMLSSVERFHPKFNSWEKHAPLGQGKKGPKGIVGACNVIFHTSYWLTFIEMESRSGDRKIRDRSAKNKQTNKQKQKQKRKRKLDGSRDRNNGRLHSKWFKARIKRIMKRSL